MSERSSKSETEQRPKVTVECIGKIGRGNPDSKISVDKIAAHNTPEKLDFLKAEICNAERHMRKIEKHDDGCIDGRCVCGLTTPDGVTKKVEPNSVHERAKVAGGGYITMFAAAAGDTAAVQLNDVIARLHEAGVVCGTHTGPHANGDGATDCGANDKFAPILDTVTDGDMAATLGGAVQQLMGDEAFDQSVFKDMRENWQQAARQAAAIQTGGERYDTMMRALAEQQSDNPEPIAVSKELKGEHRECAIIINYVEGYTFSQQSLRETMAEQYPDDTELPEVFVVDVPRIVQLVNAYTEDSEERSRLTQAAVAFQVATAMTLTDGSLPIYTIHT